MNAVIKPDHLETIYDHGVTPEELNVLFYGAPESEQEYVEGLSVDGLRVDIARLYRLRKQFDIFQRYVASISDPTTRSELAMRGCCEAHS